MQTFRVRLITALLIRFFSLIVWSAKTGLRVGELLAQGPIDWAESERRLHARQSAVGLQVQCNYLQQQ